MNENEMNEMNENEMNDDLITLELTATEITVIEAALVRFVENKELMKQIIANELNDDEAAVDDHYEAELNVINDLFEKLEF